MAAKIATRTANPMAPRSLVWSMTPEPSKHRSWKRARKVQAKAESAEKTRKTDKPKSENFPWQFNFFN
jgi:hypothetical protein